MTRFRKPPDLKTHGHHVRIRLDHPGAFERRASKASWGWAATVTTREFNDWIRDTAGPMGVLWIAERDGNEVMNIYFYKAEHALLAKLTWGGE